MQGTLNNFLDDVKSQVDASLKARLQVLNAHGTPLVNAMQYSLLLGGKRIRPALVFASAEAITHHTKTTQASSLDCACAVEAVHTYSLIHDDLPAMDDDDIRRGQPSCHKAFDEATAILAGDALQTAAFEWLLDCRLLNPAQNLEAAKILLTASGARGMVLGQAIDLYSVDTALSLENLELMHHFKTGALISASVQLGAICAAASKEQTTALTRYAQAIGLAFQVQDDILDVTGTTETLGKQAGSDAKQNKPTYPSLLGLGGAKRKCNELLDEALFALEPFDNGAERLRQLARHIVSRSM